MQKILLILVVILAIGVFGVEMRRQSQVKQLSLQVEEQQAGNQEEADRVLRKVRGLMQIDEDVTPTVATIVDVESLRERNPFYEKASNGDFLVVTPSRAILYSEESNLILDVVPVQLQQAEAATPAPAPEAPVEGEGEAPVEGE